MSWPLPRQEWYRAASSNFQNLQVQLAIFQKKKALLLF